MSEETQLDVIEKYLDEIARLKQEVKELKWRYEDLTRDADIQEANIERLKAEREEIWEAAREQISETHYRYGNILDWNSSKNTSKSTV